MDTALRARPRSAPAARLAERTAPSGSSDLEADRLRPPSLCAPLGLRDPDPEGVIRTALEQTSRGAAAVRAHVPSPARFVLLTRRIRLGDVGIAEGHVVTPEPHVGPVGVADEDVVLLAAPAVRDGLASPVAHPHRKGQRVDPRNSILRRLDADLDLIRGFGGPRGLTRPTEQERLIVDVRM